MEVQILKYTGPLDSGEVVVRQQHITSPWRKVKVYPGAQWEIGKEMPSKVAQQIFTMMGHSFKLEIVELDNDGEIRHHITDFLRGFEKTLPAKDAGAVISKLTCQSLLKIYGDDAVDSILLAMTESPDVSDVLKEKVGLKAEAEAEVEKKPRPKRTAKPRARRTK
jgi:hypothetical protein